MENKSILDQIINNTNKHPTIVNKDSSFIVITYWWGSNNQNQNIARPCLFFYEDFVNKIIKKTVFGSENRCLEKVSGHRDSNSEFHEPSPCKLSVGVLGFEPRILRTRIVNVTVTPYSVK